MWTCGKCGRKFKNKNQWHSCVRHTVAEHFKGKEPGVKKAYDKIVARLKETKPFRADAVKTEILLVAKSHFAGLTVRKTLLRVSFVIDKAVSDPRIVWKGKFGGKHAYTVKVTSPDDVDAKLVGWLKRAQALQS